MDNSAVHRDAGAVRPSRSRPHRSDVRLLHRRHRAGLAVDSTPRRAVRRPHSRDGGCRHQPRRPPGRGVRVLAFATAGSAFTLQPSDGLEMAATVGFVIAAGTIIAVGLGFMLRNTAGTLIGVFLLILVLPLLLPLFGDWMSTLAQALPGSGAIFLLFGDLPGMTKQSSVITLLAWAAHGSCVTTRNERHAHRWTPPPRPRRTASKAATSKVEEPKLTVSSTGVVIPLRALRSARKPPAPRSQGRLTTVKRDAYASPRPVTVAEPSCGERGRHQTALRADRRVEALNGEQNLHRSQCQGADPRRRVAGATQ